jgi:hypothetical protein
MQAAVRSAGALLAFSRTSFYDDKDWMLLEPGMRFAATGVDWALDESLQLESQPIHSSRC